MVGLVRGVHGLNGAVRVEILTDRPEARFANGRELYREGGDAAADRGRGPRRSPTGRAGGSGSARFPTGRPRTRSAAPTSRPTSRPRTRRAAAPPTGTRSSVRPSAAWTVRSSAPSPTSTASARPTSTSFAVVRAASSTSRPCATSSGSSRPGAARSWSTRRPSSWVRPGRRDHRDRPAHGRAPEEPRRRMSCPSRATVPPPSPPSPPSPHPTPEARSDNAPRDRHPDPVPGNARGPARREHPGPDPGAWPGRDPGPRPAQVGSRPASLGRRLSHTAVARE